MSFLTPEMSLFVFTGLKTESELIELFGVEPDDAWTINEEDFHANTDTGKVLHVISGPNSTGVRYDSPSNDDPESEFEARLTALLDRVERLGEPLQRLRASHAYPFGNMEVVLRFHTVVTPGYRTGLIFDLESQNRILALGADVFADFPFTPFDQRDGNRYRPRRTTGDLHQPSADTDSP
jgi:hypothetical protein